MKKYSELLKKFKREILKLLPEEIETIRLFGSQARGDAHEDSDVDILVVTKTDDWHLGDKIGEVAYNLLLETGIYISTKVISRKHYDYLRRLNAPFILNVLREGIVL